MNKDTTRMEGRQANESAQNETSPGTRPNAASLIRFSSFTNDGVTVTEVGHSSQSISVDVSDDVGHTYTGVIVTVGTSGVILNNIVTNSHGVGVRLRATHSESGINVLTVTATFDGFTLGTIDWSDDDVPPSVDEDNIQS